MHVFSHDAPTFDQWYLIQIAQILAQVNAKKGKRYRLFDFKLDVPKTDGAEKDNLLKQKTAAVLQHRFGRMGATVQTKTREEIEQMRRERMEAWQKAAL